MKQFFTLLITLISVTIFAQIGTTAPWMEQFSEDGRTSEPTFEEVVQSFDAYWADKDPSVKGSGYKPFKRWESVNEHSLNPDGTVLSTKQRFELWQEVQNRATKADDSDWYSVGPLAHTNTGSWSSGQGRVNVVAVDPSDANIMYVGAPAGGIWKSEDAGANWEPLLDGLPSIGVSAIAIDPLDTDIIYIGTGDDDGADTTAIGVWKSTDAGATWNVTGLNQNNSPQGINEVFISPADSNVLIASTSSGIFKSTDAGSNWSNVRSGSFLDVRLKPGDPTVVYAVTRNQFYKSTDSGDSFTLISSSAGVPSNNGRMAIEVTLANPDVVYILAAETQGNGYEFKGIYKSTDAGENFTRTSAGVPNIFESPQAWFDMGFTVSPTDENELYTGVLNVWKSTTGGASFTQINNWDNPTGVSYTHADIHFLRFFNGKLYCGSDGGVYESPDNATTFKSLTQGLAIGQFYRIDVAQQDSQRIGGGLQDNGGYARNDSQWQNYYGADGMESAIDPNNPDNVYGFIQGGGGPYISKDGGASLSGAATKPENGNWITPLTFSKEGRLLAGYQHVFEFDFCSNSWIELSNSLGFIDALVIDPNNSDNIYVITNNVLRRSTDGGSTFDILEAFNTNLSWVDVKNGDSNTLYITTSATDGEVYKGTIDGDTLNLEDITGSLPSIPKLVIKHQPLHTDNPLFLGTTNGVWRYDDITGDWETFDNNLPNTIIRDLEINTLDGNITAATYGRGVWQTNIPQDTPESDVATVRVQLGERPISCEEITPTVTLKNNGSTSVSEITITYTINGSTETLDWTGTLAPSETVDVDLPGIGLGLGTYTLEVDQTSDGDAFASNNTAKTAITFNKKGQRGVVNSFEDEDSKLLILGETTGADCGESTLWERGQPAGTLLGAAATGENAYATNLDGNHGDEIKEFLVTPCYDLSEIGDPVLKFNMAFDLELDWDILYMEYTTDGGNSWQQLGSASDANWYNSDTPNGANGTCFNCLGNQWTGTIADFNEYSYSLDALSNETDVMFRFVFHSDQAVNQEGVVIDDFVIEGTQLSTDSFNVSSLSIYPNPSNGLFQVAFQNTAKASFVVYDITGKQVLSTDVISNGTEHPIDLSQFASGMYLLQANLDGKVVTKKLLLN